MHRFSNHIFLSKTYKFLRAPSVSRLRMWALPTQHNTKAAYSGGEALHTLPIRLETNTNRQTSGCQSELGGHGRTLKKCCWTGSSCWTGRLGSHFTRPCTFGDFMYWFQSVFEFICYCFLFNFFSYVVFKTSTRSPNQQLKKYTHQCKLFPFPIIAAYLLTCCTFSFKYWLPKVHSFYSRCGVSSNMS